MISTCTKSEFAAIVGKSRAYIDILDAQGVISVGYGNEVFLQASLYQYFFDFLYHLEDRDKAFLAAVEKISKQTKNARRLKKDALNSCRLLLPLISFADLNLSVLKFLKKLGGNFPASFIIKKTRELDNLREHFKKNQQDLKKKISAAKLPNVAAETILLARYVDCDCWRDIAEDYNLSLSTCYRLHRQGVQFLKNAK